MADVAIIDYGMGNLRSVCKAVEHVAAGASVIVTSDPAVVRASARVIFPGQGAMPDCMHELQARGLRDAVLEASRNKPFLGICVGEQMLFEHSEEGDVPGLGIFSGEVLRFPPAASMKTADGGHLKVPHMGWNRVEQTALHPLWAGIESGDRFYFVHSFYVSPADPVLTAAETEYGLRFTSAVARDNIFAVQFHPEKSAAAGLQLLSNFLAWAP